MKFNTTSHMCLGLEFFFFLDVGFDELSVREICSCNKKFIIKKLIQVYVLYLQVCGGERPYMNPDSLDREHRRVLDHALELFNGTRKMGGPQFSQTYEDQLQVKIFSNVLTALPLDITAMYSLQ